MTASYAVYVSQNPEPKPLDDGFKKLFICMPGPCGLTVGYRERLCSLYVGLFPVPWVALEELVLLLERQYFEEVQL